MLDNDLACRQRFLVSVLSFIHRFVWSLALSSLTLFRIELEKERQGLERELDEAHESLSQESDEHKTLQTAAFMACSDLRISNSEGLSPTSCYGEY